MPELPEVETVRKGLEKQVTGSRIGKVEVFWPNIIREPAVAEFEENLKGEEVLHVGRRGKFLVIQLTHWTLISHLRMEGKYVIKKADDPIQKHTHVIFHLEDGRDLRYLDVRKFGKMSLIPKGEETNAASLVKLGPEPQADQFKFEEMFSKIKKHKKPIKALLLDQTFVAGIGNIYADEVLFRAFILPDRPANSLSEKEARNLYEAILNVMQQAIEAGGTTIRTYQNSFGETGGYQNQLSVYGRHNQACPRCGQLIQKGKVAQRGTHYCPNCQR